MLYPLELRAQALLPGWLNSYSASQFALSLVRATSTVPSLQAVPSRANGRCDSNTSSAFFARFLSCASHRIASSDPLACTGMYSSYTEAVKGKFKQNADGPMGAWFASDSDGFRTRDSQDFRSSRESGVSYLQTIASTAGPEPGT
jgi:hypothetical protein